MEENTLTAPGEGASQEPWISPEFEPGLVSVIIPTYNRAHLILETLDSVAAQTYRPIELIIVDDGSTDNTKEVVEDWIDTKAPKDDFHVRFIEQANAGAPAARNHGARESKGEFIQFLDSDDIINLNKIKLSIIEFIEDAAIDLVYSMWSTENINGAISLVKGIPNLVQNSAPDETVYRNLHTMSPVFKRKLVQKAGPWNERLSWSQEWEWHARILSNRPRSKLIKLSLSVVRERDGTKISRNGMSTDRLQTAYQSLASFQHCVFNSPGENYKQAVSEIYKLYIIYAVHALVIKNIALCAVFVRSAKSIEESLNSIHAHWKITLAIVRKLALVHPALSNRAGVFILLLLKIRSKWKRFVVNKDEQNKPE